MIVCKVLIAASLVVDLGSLREINHAYRLQILVDLQIRMMLLLPCLTLVIANCLVKLSMLSTRDL